MNQVVTITNGTRQYDVTERADGMVRLWPRHPVNDEDGGRWVSEDITRPVPADKVIPYDDEDDDRHSENTRRWNDNHEPTRD
jgi:hypothetical protein